MGIRYFELVRQSIESVISHQHLISLSKTSKIYGKNESKHKTHHYLV
jgi:hypothetical protein